MSTFSETIKKKKQLIFLLEISASGGAVLRYSTNNVIVTGSTKNRLFEGRLTSIGAVGSVLDIDNMRYSISDIQCELMNDVRLQDDIKHNREIRYRKRKTPKGLDIPRNKCRHASI